MSSQILGQLQLNFEEIPAVFEIDLPHAARALDILYLDNEPDRQCFDLFSPDTTQVWPLVIYIHGGGFTSNNKSNYYNGRRGVESIKYFLEAGCTFVSMDYRLLNVGNEDVGFRKPINDVFYALQFIKHHHKELQIDPHRISVYGSSAGAGTSILLGVTDNRADLSSADIIRHQSTRVCAVGALSTQASYDLHRWSSDVYQNYDSNGSSLSLEDIRDHIGAERFSMFYGGFEFDQFYTDSSIINYRKEMDMLELCSSDDPPLYIYNPSRAQEPGEDITHHSLHGKVLNEYASNAGLEVKADIPMQSINTTEGESYQEFLVRETKKCQLSTNSIDIQDEPSYLLYPNPFKHSVQVLSDSAPANMQVYNSQGQLIHQGSEALYFTSFWPSGYYIFKLDGKSLIGVKP